MDTRINKLFREGIFEEPLTAEKVDRLQEAYPEDDLSDLRQCVEENNV